MRNASAVNSGGSLRSGARMARVACAVIALCSFLQVALVAFGGEAGLTLANAHFDLTIDRTNGSIASLVHPADPARMTWITGAENAPWQMRSLQWGLGRANLGSDQLHRARWEIPRALSVEGPKAVATYQVGPLKVEVTRELVDDALQERYVFTNTGTTTLPLTHWAPGAFGLYAPFNDNYTTAEDCLERRSHSHIWCGGSSAWICGLRMGGRGPHLGLVVTEGRVEAYSIGGRDMATSSNTRGVFILHPDAAELPPGQSYTLAWTLFWHQGWADFFAQCAKRSRTFVAMSASRYTVQVGERVDLQVRGDASLAEPRLIIAGNEQPLAGAERPGLWTASWRATAPGDVTAEFTATPGVQTVLRLHVVPPVEDLLAARVRFIVERQQCNHPGDPLDGAYLVYDNERDALVRRDWGHDHNEGRERLAMGVLLGRWLRAQKDRPAALQSSLDRYYRFVCDKLQKPDGTVLNGVGDPTERLYNWPWVMQLHVEMARLTGRKEPIDRFVLTARRFYQAGGAKLYAIGLPIFEGLRLLEDAGRRADADLLRALFIRHGENIARSGTRYPPHEVNFEQSIVAPAAILLLELYAATGEQRWLDAAAPHLQCLEPFHGRQPDHRLHEVAIRHWDGYWFGKARLWGDTFPHYWSTLSAVAFHRYGAATNNPSFTERAHEIVRNNLSLFRPDGRASCAFVYPLTVNDQPASVADAYANDQDWALVHWLMVTGR